MLDLVLINRMENLIQFQILVQSEKVKYQEKEVFELEEKNIEKFVLKKREKLLEITGNYIEK